MDAGAQLRASSWMPFVISTSKNGISWQVLRSYPLPIVARTIGALDNALSSST